MTQGNDAEGIKGAQEPKVSLYNFYALGVLVLVYALNFIDRNIISILANDIKADLGLSDADLGYLYGTAFGVFYALFGIPLGRLADSWQRTRLMSMGLALWSGMTAISGFAQNGAMLAAARVGVGVGEASASPSAYSLISDWFPKKMRATALAIYSAGLYIGGGVSLFIGALVVEKWNAAFPDGGPLGFVGWQAAFMVVGLPGLLLAVWVLTLREPVRGAFDGVAAAPSPHPFRDFFNELFTVIPPLTLIGAARNGQREFILNLCAAVVAFCFGSAMISLTGNGKQWGTVAVGYYAVFSWARALKLRDPATFKLIWGTPAFLYTIIGYAMVSFGAYASSFWSAPYAESVLGASKYQAALVLGGLGAVAGFLGAIFGGLMSDFLRLKNPAGRILMIAFGLCAPVIPFIIAFTTDNLLVFYSMHLICAICSSSALGAAAATTQDLVLPSMRGTATATFFIAISLTALALGPYMVGEVSDLTGSRSVGTLSALISVPIGLFALWRAYRLVPIAEASAKSRAEMAKKESIVIIQ